MAYHKNKKKSKMAHVEEMVNVEDDLQADYYELRDELARLRERNTVLTTSLNEANLLARGWRYNAQQLLADQTLLLAFSNNTLRRVAEFLRVFGPMPRAFLDGQAWQVEADYAPQYNMGLQQMMTNPQENDTAYWLGVFHARDEFGQLE